MPAHLRTTYPAALLRTHRRSLRGKPAGTAIRGNDSSCGGAGEAEAGTAWLRCAMRFADRPRPPEVRIERRPSRCGRCAPICPAWVSGARRTWAGVGGRVGRTAVAGSSRARNRHRPSASGRRLGGGRLRPAPRFAWSVGEPDGRRHWSFELEPDGRDALRQRATMGPGRRARRRPSTDAGQGGAHHRPPLQEWEAGMQAVLNGIKAEAEAEQRAASLRRGPRPAGLSRRRVGRRGRRARRPPRRRCPPGRPTAGSCPG